MAWSTVGRRNDVIKVPRKKTSTTFLQNPAPVVTMPVELLTVRQAATFAQASQPTIRRWIRAEGLPAYRSKGKGRVRIDKADLVKFLRGDVI
ncbi:DNA-binding protein [Sphingopyxis terrae subsp. ummariensis]|nr:DNA-binding protein [Sphingopyxis terrae subsp. ummariensis]